MTLDEWNTLPPGIRKTLQDYGMNPKTMHIGAPGQEPYTIHGAPGTSARQYTTDSLPDSTDAATYMATPKKGAPSTSSPSAILYNPKSDPKYADMVQAHEMEHVLSNQGRGSSNAINKEWDKNITADGADRHEMVSRMVQAAPYLVKNWGLDPQDAEGGYFSKNLLSHPDKNAYWNEQMATLSALEQGKNRSLTDDPYLREIVFKTPAERETYNALTGLRQTRTDARDLPPYTRQAEAGVAQPVAAKADVSPAVQSVLQQMPDNLPDYFQ